MKEFTSEDDLQTFDGWLKYQAAEAATPQELEILRRLYSEMMERSAKIPKVGLMKLQPVPGEYLYAVAFQEQEAAELWLTLWVKRSPKGEFFVIRPTRGDPGWNLHTSYHLDGALHMKSHGRKVLPRQRRQPLTGVFRESEHLGVYYGHSPKGVGAICDPKAFSGVVKVAPGVLGPTHGWVTVDLVEPGKEPAQKIPWARIITREFFRDILPWVVITVGVDD